MGLLLLVHTICGQDIYDPRSSRMLSEDPHWNVGNMIYGDDPEFVLETDEDDDPLGLNKYTYKAYRPDYNAIMQSGNLYVYGLNNPVRFFDPSGLVSVDMIEYAKAMGANVSDPFTDKDGKTRVTITFGKIKQDYYVNNGKIDDSKLNTKFGWTNPWIPSGKTQAVHLGAQTVLNSPAHHHSSTIIFAGYDSELLELYDMYFVNSYFGMLYAAIGAGPSSYGAAMKGDIMYGFINHNRDTSIKNMVETVNLGVYDVRTIQSLFTSTKAYIMYWQQSVQYPNLGFNVNAPYTYNSNSFTHGLLIAIGITVPNLKSRLPGWVSPLPSHYYRGYHFDYKRM